MIRTKALVIVIFILIAASCARISPKVIQAGANDYNVAMQNTRNEQMLLNLVRLKYRDTPFFMEVNSVSSQFKLSSEASLSTNFREQQIPESVGLFGKLNFVEQPTISYTPLSGNEFVQRLLTPVSIDTLLLLSNSGWSISRVFRLCAQQINQFPNAPSASGPTPEHAPEFKAFKKLVDLLRNMQAKNLIRLGHTNSSQQGTPLLLIAEGAADDVDVQSFRRLLGLNENIQAYPLISGNNSAKNTEAIYIANRSLLGIMFYLSHSVRVPERDKQRGLVTVTRDDQGDPFDWNTLTEGLFHISSNDEAPTLTSISTYYRGSWFYIDDRDLDSKSTFSLLSQIFSLQAGKVEGIIPVLTLPVGQ